MRTSSKFKLLSMLTCLIVMSQEIQAVIYDDPMRTLDDYPGLVLVNLWSSGSKYDITHAKAISPADDTLSGEVRIPGIVELDGDMAMTNWPWCNIMMAAGFNKCKGITSVIFEGQNLSYECEKEENGHVYKYVQTIVNVAEINDSVFYGLPELTYAELKQNRIPPHAFADCPKLARVTTKDDKYIGVHTKAFANCHSLETIADGNNTGIAVEAHDSAFINCTSFNPDYGMFYIYRCEKSAFENCTSLTDAVIDASIIGQRAFAGCTSLHSITLGSRTEEVGDYAFAECSAIADVYCMSLEPPVANNNFMTDYTATLHIPTGTGEKYRIAPGWRNFTNIVEDIDPTVGVAGVTQSNISIEAIDTKIIISGNDDNDAISVYDIAGRQVYRGHDNEINLPGSGIYIVNINKMTQKVIIK